jgi:hypothetical protein
VSLADIQPIVVGVLQGLISSSVFVLALFIGFCVIIGFAKTKRTAGTAPVVKSLDEAINHQAVTYLPPTAPRGPIDQLAGSLLTHEK